MQLDKQPTQNTGGKMSPIQAKTEAKRMAKMGVPYREIATKLKEGGYLGPKGKPLCSSGVSQMLIKQGVRRKRPNKAKVSTAAVPQSRAKHTGKLGAVRSILQLKEMQAEEKIALALLVLDGSKA